MTGPTAAAWTVPVAHASGSSLDDVAMMAFFLATLVLAWYAALELGGGEDQPPNRARGALFTVAATASLLLFLVVPPMLR